MESLNVWPFEITSLNVSLWKMLISQIIMRPAKHFESKGWGIAVGNNWSCLRFKEWWYNWLYFLLMKVITNVECVQTLIPKISFQKGTIFPFVNRTKLLPKTFVYMSIGFSLNQMLSKYRHIDYRHYWNRLFLPSIGSPLFSLLRNSISVTCMWSCRR